MTLKPTFLSVSAAAEELDVPVDLILDKGMVWNGDDKLQLYIRLPVTLANKWVEAPHNQIAFAPATKIDGKYMYRSDAVLSGYFPVFQQQILTILVRKELDHCFPADENDDAHHYEFQEPVKLDTDDLFVKYGDMEDFLPINSNPKDEDLLFKVFSFGMGLMKEYIPPEQLDKIHFSRDDMVEKAAVFGISSTLARKLHKQMDERFKGKRGKPKK